MHLMYLWGFETRCVTEDTWRPEERWVLGHVCLILLHPGFTQFDKKLGFLATRRQQIVQASVEVFHVNSYWPLFWKSPNRCLFTSYLGNESKPFYYYILMGNISFFLFFLTTAFGNWWVINYFQQQQNIILLLSRWLGFATVVKRGPKSWDSHRKGICQEGIL